MTIGRLLLAGACLVIAWVELVLAALLWPLGDALPPIDAVDTWLAGFVTLGTGLLLYAMYRQVARPLIDSCQALLLAARGLPSAAAAPHFGRADEIGEIAVALATLQAEQAKHGRLDEELVAWQAETAGKLEEIAGLGQLMDDVLDAVPVPVSVCDLEGRIAFVNRAWEACFGVSREAVLGLHAGDDGTQRQDEVRLRGRLYHRSHAVVPGSEGQDAAVVTTFRPVPEAEAPDPETAKGLAAIARETQRLLQMPMDPALRAQVESIAASVASDRAGALL